MNETHDPLANFTGVARLFPLPNLVLFPHVLQPLHIFEPRYRQMTQDALAGDRLIGMALLRPDWEKEYLEQPAIHPIICLCKVVADQELEDGRFNLLVRGLARARVVDEPASDKLYRVARVELLRDQSEQPLQQCAEYRSKFQALLADWFPDQPAVLAEFTKLLTSDIALGMLCDILSFALPLQAEFKQSLLAEPDVQRRACCLLDRLAARTRRRFPPEFSCN